MNNNEITNFVYVRTGRRLGDHTAERILSEEVVPLKLSRLFEPYYEIEDSRERQGAVVTLHLDALSYARLMHWRILGNEGLARREVALWLSNDALAVQHAGETLSRYEVLYQSSSGGQVGKLLHVWHPELFEIAHHLPQPRLLDLEEALGDGWLKVPKLDGYSPRRIGRAQALKDVLFPYLKAL